jgi:hypothetical protein
MFVSFATGRTACGPGRYLFRQQPGIKPGSRFRLSSLSELLRLQQGGYQIEQQCQRYQPADDVFDVHNFFLRLTALPPNPGFGLSLSIL